MLSPNQHVHGFDVQTKCDLAEIDGIAYTMVHAKSGARLLYLQNDDDNKAFSIAFKTPPVDDTGVFHILEHSVLCGSDKFPVKEPFVNLLRTSMQTFLNALTFPDKTMYPVASTNEQDLLNLMDVYLDAVLNPSIYREPEIFQQEGWHYEVCTPEPDGAASDGQDSVELVYNGVVFNEMKGTLSNPENVLYHAINKALYPDTCYAFESGGRPRAIPQLTYEQFLDTHARHYRLDNSYIVLYGNMDIDRVLAFLDQRYLGCVKPRSAQPANPIGMQQPCIAMNEEISMVTAPENACVALGYVVGHASDFERIMAVEVLLDALMGGNEAPIKRAVLDSGLGGDCMAYVVDSQAQPAALFMLKNAQPGSASAFAQLIEDEVDKLLRDGIPRDVLDASLAQMAFSLRERDRGVADGVALAMNALSGWLYNDDDPTLHLRYEQPLEHMRAGLDAGYFESVLRSLVPQSQHKALVSLVPCAPESPTEEQVELAAFAQGLTDQQVQEIRDAEAALRVRQEAPDAPEDLAKLPQLHVSDIGPAKPDPPMQLRTDTPLPCLRHTVPTRHIAYLYAYFDLGDVPWDDLPYVSILSLLLGNLDTDEHTAAQLDTHTRSHLGSLRFFVDNFVERDNPQGLQLKFTVGASALSEEIEHLAAIPREVWERTRFDDKARIADMLTQRRIAMEESFATAGHTRAMGRLGSYLMPSGQVSEQLLGIDFYWFLKDLIEHFDERFDSLSAKLEQVRAAVFTGRGFVASFTGDDADFDRFWQLAGTMGLDAQAAQTPEGQPGICPQRTDIPEPVVRNEAFVVPSSVGYLACGADLSKAGPHTGAWVVLSNVLSFDYLWNTVRVAGGAYGTGFRHTPQGFGRFYSYRDPQVDATFERFAQAPAWLEAFDPTEAEMEGYIVSTVASHDAPTKPRMVARRQDSAYLGRLPEGHREVMRQQELDVTPDQLRALAHPLAQAAGSDARCIFGGAEAIDAASTPFDARITLIAADEVNAADEENAAG